MRVAAAPPSSAVCCMSSAGGRMPALLWRSAVGNAWRLSASGGVLPRGSASCPADGAQSALQGRTSGLRCRLPWLQQQRRQASAGPLLYARTVAAASAGSQTVPAVEPASSASSSSSGGNGGPQTDAAAAKAAAYPFNEIEAKWQRYWIENKTFRTPDFKDLDTSKPKYYVLDMFPYPSGAGLHVGHPEGYTATDIVARMKRQQGYNVLHPIGFDAFGLPAEQYAIQTGTHPRETTKKNCDRFREQLQSLGFSYDWDREISTTDPDYYKWTQWIFLQLFKRGLAYQAEVPVNWCPALGTVLANEEVINGRSERGDHPVVRMPLRQWMLAITRYADRLLGDLSLLDWDSGIKALQRTWIGRSEGAGISFELRGAEGCSLEEGAQLEVYTTRPDTLFGATYMVVAPEHPLVAALTAPGRAEEVTAYVEAAASKSDLERTELAKGKSGVDTGSFAINPATGEPMPVWVADYVLGGYGSGAIMAVPAHDTRDYEFAEAFGLPIRHVVGPAEGDAPSPTADADGPFSGHGVAMNSSSETARLQLDGLATKDASAEVIRWLEERGCGSRQVNFKLRDWLFARQRYWGEPFPVVFPEGSDEAVAIDEADLPLVLPDTDNFQPRGTPESPLSVIEEWMTTTDPTTGGPARRESSTMPQWAGSCWYYLRYIDPGNDGALVDPEAEKYWMPVDLYVGGAEHAVLHLLYARFWHKVLFDIGAVSGPEPFQRLVSQGMILGETEYTLWKGPDGQPAEPESDGAIPTRVAAADIEKAGDGYCLRGDPASRVSARAHKMSKSRGNVVNPDDVVERFGADSLRLYEMFMGPLRDTKVWSTNGVEGVYRFLGRAWRLFEGGTDPDAKPSPDQLRAVHSTIKRVTEETEALRFNTGISAMMEFVNAATKWPAPRPAAALKDFVVLLSPYAPHIAEELWGQLGHSGTLAYHPWPVHDPALLVETTVNLPVQVNGKMRGAIQVDKGISQDDAMAAALAELDNVRTQTEGKEIQKVIFVPGRIMNIMVK
mmetsp:Transcript_21063/g.63390  ORF Transcript_21063/g.63390 Transcript_21063/m.63390 type:complete len:1009 (+) Transcript_21063:168-3194(+)